MSWQVYISLSVFFYSVVTLLQRVLVKEKDSSPIAYSIFFQLLTGGMVLIIGFLFTDMSLPNLGPLLPNLVLMTVLYGIGTAAIFESLKRTEASKFIVIFSSRALFTILASSLIILEGLTFNQFIGAFFVLGGVVVVNLKSTRFSLGKGELFGLVAAICYGFTTTNDRYLLQHLSVYPYLVMAFILPALFMITLFPREVSNVKLILKKKFLQGILVLSATDVISSLLFFLALQTSINSSQIGAINITSIIVTALLAVIFLKERENIPKKVLGAVLSFAGLLLLI